MFRRISRVTAWLLLFLIAVFSVISPYNRVVTIVPHTVEHLASFLFVGAWQLGSATPLGTGHRVFFYCARPLLSLRNFGLRGRHARIGDFLVYLLAQRRDRFMPEKRLQTTMIFVNGRASSNGGSCLLLVWPPDRPRLVRKNSRTCS